MADRPQHPYECQNFGCPNGHLSVFLAAPPEWFEGKGLSTPRGCPDCRRWIDAQIDSAHSCRVCSWVIRQPARYKISYHKKEGPYETPRHCEGCLEGDLSFLEDAIVPVLPEIRDPEVLPIVQYDELSNYRKIHFGKHIVDHPFSEVGTIMSSGRPVSMTSLVGASSTTVDFYNACSGVAERTADVYQYWDGNKILKATIVGGTHVEVTFFKPLRGGEYEPVTSYDELSILEARSKIDSGDWI